MLTAILTESLLRIAPQVRFRNPGLDRKNLHDSPRFHAIHRLIAVLFMQLKGIKSLEKPQLSPFFKSPFCYITFIG